jgi:hypothetical protein
MASMLSRLSTLFKARSRVDAGLAALKAQLDPGAPAPAHPGERPRPPELIMRVQGSGQYRLAQPEIDALHGLEHQLAGAVQRRDARRVHEVLGRMVDVVQTRGTRLDPDSLLISETILPPDTLTIEEVHALLRDDGLLRAGEPAPVATGAP